MNITLVFILQESTNEIADETGRKRAGSIVDLFASDQFVTLVDGEYALNSPPSLNIPFGYIHVRDYPEVDLLELRSFLIEPAMYGEGDEITPIRPRNWLIDFSLFEPETVANLARTAGPARRQSTIGWTDELAAKLRWLEVSQLANPATDALGRSLSVEELPGG